MGKRPARPFFLFCRVISAAAKGAAFSSGLPPQPGGDTGRRKRRGSWSAPDQGKREGAGWVSDPPGPSFYFVGFISAAAKGAALSSGLPPQSGGDTGRRGRCGSWSAPDQSKREGAGWVSDPPGLPFHFAGFIFAGAKGAALSSGLPPQSGGDTGRRKRRGFGDGPKPEKGRVTTKRAGISSSAFLLLFP